MDVALAGSQKAQALIVPVDSPPTQQQQLEETEVLIAQGYQPRAAPDGTPVQIEPQPDVAAEVSGLEARQVGRP